MVLMCGLVLTLFAAVMFAWTTASAWAGVSAATAGVVAESAFWTMNGVASASAAAATTARRVRVGGMGGALPQSLVKLTNRSKHP